MSASAFFPHETLFEDYSKIGKQNSKQFSLQNSYQQQTALNRLLPPIFQTAPSVQLPQKKAEENTQALNYFNNPYPLYCLIIGKGENDITDLFNNSNLEIPGVSNQSNMSYLSNAVSPQVSFPNGLAVCTPAPSKPVQRKERKHQKYSEKCTCKRLENHIPRPRNAFILFRQKHHQSVLKESTNLKTNPEVSRELARRWRALTKEEREHWDSLADEEKKNHALKYPNYRYKPRRHKKNSSCEVCLVKVSNRLSPRPQSQSVPQNYTQMISPTEQKLLKLFTGLGQHQHQNHQHFHQLNGHLQIQYQQQMDQPDPAYPSQRSLNYGNYIQLNQYEFGDGMSNSSPSLQHQQTSHIQQQGQQLIQQQYPMQLQNRDSQGNHPMQMQSPMSHAQLDNYAVMQEAHLLDQHQVQANPEVSTQGMMNDQFHNYGEKYQEESFHYADQSAMSHKYNSLPIHGGSATYNSNTSDPFTIPTLLQLY